MPEQSRIIYYSSVAAPNKIIFFRLHRVSRPDLSVPRSRPVPEKSVRCAAVSLLRRTDAVDTPSINVILDGDAATFIPTVNVYMRITAM